MASPTGRTDPDIAEVIRRHLNVPVVSVALEDADAHSTWLAHYLAVDGPASSTLTERLTGSR